MKTINVSEADGVVLDYLVAKAQGLTPTVHVNPYGYVVLPNIPSSYCEDWKYGGPIIDHVKISITNYHNGQSSAWFYSPGLAPSGQSINSLCMYGPTPLIAAMRLYVRWMLGAEVEVPDDLFSTIKKEQA